MPPTDDGLFSSALQSWISVFAPIGILVTDSDLRVRSVNRWFLGHLGYQEPDLLGKSLLEIFPSLKERRLDRHLYSALRGEARVLSHRFHRYFVPLPVAAGNEGFEHMQQSALVSPLWSGESVIGTVVMIQDVTDRAARERDLSAQVRDREEQIRRAAVLEELSKENESLKDRNKRLGTKERQLSHLNRRRERFLHLMMRSQEDERRRIARDLHDNLGQQMTALRLSIALLKQTLERGENPFLDIAKIESITSALDSDLDFISAELRLRGLEDLGLERALREFTSHWSRHFGIRTEFHCSSADKLALTSDAAVNLYRITQEALNNVAKHACAEHVSVLLECRDQTIVLIIEDDGVGFDAKGTSAKIRDKGGAGLIGMRERATLLNGTLEVESAKGRGTSVYVRIDLDQGAVARIPDPGVSTRPPLHGSDPIPNEETELA